MVRRVSQASSLKSRVEKRHKKSRTGHKVLQQWDEKADRIFFRSKSNERNGSNVKCSLSLWRSASACFIFHPFSLWAPFRCKTWSSVLTKRTRGAVLYTRHTRKLTTRPESLRTGTPAEGSCLWAGATARPTHSVQLRTSLCVAVSCHGSVPTDVDKNCLCTQLAGHTTNQRNKGTLIGRTAPQWVVAKSRLTDFNLDAQLRH